MVSIIVVLVCLLINALLSGAEMAFVTIDKKLLRKKVLEGDKRALYIESMLLNPERILSVVQIGITLVGVISGAVGGAGAEENLAPYLMGTFSMEEDIAETISILIVVVPLTILSVIIGELVPKSFAIRFGMPIIIALAPGLKLAEKLLGPLVNPMEKATNFIVRLFLSKNPLSALTSDNEEISFKGLRTEFKEYFNNLFDLDSMNVQSTMIPWDKVDTISSTATADEVLEKIVSTRRTRIPVVDYGDVYGYVHAKEFISLSKGGIGENWLSFIRPIHAITPDTKLLMALKTMQKSKAHIMIVGSLDKPFGILTLEDIIEEVIGDIIDEDEDGKVKHYLRRQLKL